MAAPPDAHDEHPDGQGYDEGSDADSDLEELQDDINKFDQSVRAFLDSHRGGERATPTTRGGPRGRGARGPRKAAKPRGDITARLARVNQAFLTGDYDRALSLASEVIRINAETHQAWTALASIFREQGELDRSLAAMVYAAHLRPKDVSEWMSCADFALDTIDVDENGNLNTARLCYSAALRADPTNLEARLGKATVCHRQNHYAAAIQEYNMVLRHRPRDLEVVRKLAEACMDNKNAETAVASAIAAYRDYFRHARADSEPFDRTSLWQDVSIYVELFASVDRHQEAVYELKSLSRWIVGREAEKYWDMWQDDDREWDAENDRRSIVSEFGIAGSVVAFYGHALPDELRARLAIYRLCLGHIIEAMAHLNWLDPEEHATRNFVTECPYITYELAGELAKADRPVTAIKYLEILQEIIGEADPAISLQLGRCHLAMGEQSSAEECFLAALDADEDSIEARIELANMYEKAREDEEALILAAEAMALQEAREPQEGDEIAGESADTEARGRRDRPQQRDTTRGARPRAPVRANRSSQPVIPKRYRPKRLGGADKRRQEERERALRLSQQYQAVRELKSQISAGQQDLVSQWMASSKELIDDFRSLKRFYTWDKYLHFLGSKGPAEHPLTQQPGSELSQMYERLTRNVAPNGVMEPRGQQRTVFENHQGISFDDWLDLFLDYAIGLAIEHRREEAYSVCEAAIDSTVFQSSRHTFSIYVAWSVCAIYTSDDERCVTTARHLMRDDDTSDSYRMFALLSKLCHSPASWYTSGPAQKYILRQIKAIDVAHEPLTTGVMQQAPGRRAAMVQSADVKLDVCLLMLYGHILFTSTSYAYALGYFLRARSLDPTNDMINLSLGLAYVHYGLKRQSSNRQHLLLQGQVFLIEYARPSDGRNTSSLAERYYNIGRLFHLLGIPYLSHLYYNQALEASEREGASKDVTNSIMFNYAVSMLSVKNEALAFLIMKAHLKI